jgi:hypothetical protein
MGPSCSSGMSRYVARCARILDTIANWRTICSASGRRSDRCPATRRFGLACRAAMALPAWQAHALAPRSTSMATGAAAARPPSPDMHRRVCHTVCHGVRSLEVLGSEPAMVRTSMESAGTVRATGGIHNPSQHGAAAAVICPACPSGGFGGEHWSGHAHRVVPAFALQLERRRVVRSDHRGRAHAADRRGRQHPGARSGRGTGNPRMLVVTVNSCEGPRAHAGVVSSSFEQVTSDFDHLTDQRCSSLLSSSPPADVGWMQDLVVR